MKPFLLSHKLIYSIALSAGLLSGCTAVGPNYTSPKIALAGSYAVSQPDAKRAMQTNWWSALHDKYLNTLVARGLSQNIDLQIAKERAAQLQALYSASGIPAHMNGSIDYSSIRAGGGGAVPTTTDTVTAGGNYVLDIFGRLQRLHEEAGANFQASEYSAMAARLAFLSNLVGSYIDARYYQRAVALTQRTISNRRKMYLLVQKQKRIGTASNLDVTLAKSRYEQVVAALPPLQARFDAAVYSLATLLAEPAGSILANMKKPAPQPLPPMSAGIGSPADLLRNRPDVRAAERAYAAAVAAVGVATANMYPSLTLGGTITLGSSNSWSFGPTLNLPLFNQPALDAKRRAAIKVAEQRKLEWRKSVLTAVQEVQSEQSRFLNAKKEVTVWTKTVDSLYRLRKLYAKDYALGSASLLDLLTTERDLFNAQLALAQAKRNAGLAWARLQVATGRGWMTG